MISIEYTKNIVEGEPGPNLYWRGLPEDFRVFAKRLKNLIDNKSLRIINDKNVRLYGVKEIIIEINDYNKCLISFKDKKVLTSLKKELIKKIILIFETISEKPSHNYIEFDEYDDLQEDANWIISSYSK